MIRLTVPEIHPSDIEAVSEVLASGFLVQGRKVGAFEDALGEYLGVDGVVAVGSGTAALHLALLALGIGEGDEVLVPDFTFPATGNAVIHAGATPVLVDIEKDSLCMDPEAARDRISPRTAAIMPVHAFGRPAPLSGLSALAEEHGLLLVEDAACALGSEIDGRKCGGLAAAGCFSFHPRKIITTGEGGAVVSRDPAVCDRVRSLRSHGTEPEGPALRFTSVGYNFRMTEIGAVLGLGQLGRLEEILAKKAEIVAEYRSGLEKIDGVETLPPFDQGREGYQSFVVILDDGLDRDRIVQRTRDMGVETTIGTYALHREPLFQKEFGYSTGRLPVSDWAFQHSLTLPLYPTMRSEDVERVCEVVDEAIGEQQ